MVKQPTSIKISSSVRPTQSHILAMVVRSVARATRQVLTKTPDACHTSPTAVWLTREREGENPAVPPRRVEGHGRG